MGYQFLFFKPLDLTTTYSDIHILGTKMEISLRGCHFPRVKASQNIGGTPHGTVQPNMSPFSRRSQMVKTKQMERSQRISPYEDLIKPRGVPSSFFNFKHLENCNYPVVVPFL